MKVQVVAPNAWANKSLEVCYVFAAIREFLPSRVAAKVTSIDSSFVIMYDDHVRLER